MYLLIITAECIKIQTTCTTCSFVTLHKLGTFKFFRNLRQRLYTTKRFYKFRFLTITFVVLQPGYIAVMQMY